jgi:transposase
MDDNNFLPDDLEQCQQLLLAAYKQSVQLESQAAKAGQRATELDRVLNETAASYQELQHEHAATLEQLAELKRWAFGRRRERVSDAEGQGHLFELDPPSDSKAEDTTLGQEAEVEIKGHRRRKKRQIDWDQLKQVRHEYELSEEEKTCSCCDRLMDRIGEDITRELEYEPSKLEAHIHVRPKYACRRCKDGVKTAPMPPRPIPGGIAGPGLIAQVIVSKFADHLPLHRQEDILTRHGVFLSRSSQSDWVKAVADLIQPLHDLQRQRVLQSQVMWTDDTHVTVLGNRDAGNGEKGGSFKGYFWTYIGDQQNPYSVYDFTSDRCRAGPARFLEGYAGYLHADAYTGYDAMFLGVGSKVHEVACWAHARRKFLSAVGNAPREAHTVLEWIRQLHDIEERARTLTVDARRKLRAHEANPVLDKIEPYLAELSLTALPKSNLSKAITYARNQWEALRRYTEDGRLTIDNNVSERTLRHQAIGRKNWLFLGSEAAGPRAAVLSTILAGAKRHHIEPWAYVRDLLVRLHGDETQLEELLPDRWAAAHPEAILSHRLEESRDRAIRTRARRAHRRACSK